MRGPLVERQAHLSQVVVFVVDPGQAWRGMVKDALGNCVGYTELRKARPASSAQVVGA